MLIDQGLPSDGMRSIRRWLWVDDGCINAAASATPAAYGAGVGGQLVAPRGWLTDREYLPEDIALLGLSKCRLDLLARRKSADQR